MQRETKTRIGIATLIYLMTNAVLFGIGLVTVLTVPALSANAVIWIPVVVAGSFILGVPIAWEIAPRLRARYWRQRTAARAGHFAAFAVCNIADAIGAKGKATVVSRARNP